MEISRWVGELVVGGSVVGVFNKSSVLSATFKFLGFYFFKKIESSYGYSSTT